VNKNLPSTGCIQERNVDCWGRFFTIAIKL